MKNILKTIILLPMLTTSLVNGQNINYIYIKDIPKKANYIDDFKKTSDKVNENYTHLEAKNIDGVSLQANYFEFVKNAKSNLEYGKILISYFAALKNSHTNVIFNKYYKKCTASLIENRVFFSYIGDSVLIKNGVKEKDEIIKIDHIPVLSYIQNQAKYIPASTEIHRTYLAVSDLFSSYFEEDRIYTIKTLSGEKEITLHFGDKPIQPENEPTQAIKKIESSVLMDSVGYISLLSMTGNVVDEFIKAFDTLSQKHFLIIDLRRNQGGNSGYSEKIAEYLILKKQKASVSNRWLSPKDNHFTGKLFVLTSAYTASAAESFALDLLESGNVTLIGMPTAGDTGNQPQFYSSQLGYSYWFPSRNKAQISPKGFPMEGESIQPHYTVFKTIPDFFKNRDTILAYTLNLISKK